MSDQPLLVRTPDQRWPEIPEIPRHVPPKLDRKTLQRIRAALVRLLCQN